MNLAALLRPVVLLTMALHIWLGGNSAFAMETTQSLGATAESFHKLLDEEWQYGLRENPEFASYVGDPRYNDRWTDNSEEAIEKRRVHARDLLKRVEAIDRAQLGEEDQLSYDLYLLNARNSVEGLRFRGDYMPINQMGGVYSDIAETARIAPRASQKDFQDQIARLRGVPKMVDQTIQLMRRGLDEGITPPRPVLGKVSELIGNQIVDDPTSSPIYEVIFGKMPESMAPDTRSQLQAEGAKVLRDEVIPSLRKLRTFWDDVYLSRTRETISLSDLPDGQAWYAFRAKQSTTTDLTPAEIHEIGLREVKRIREEMEKTKTEAGFTGTLPEFFEYLRTDPKFFYSDARDLLAGYRDICKRIDPELPRLFRTLPRLTYGVQPVPAYSEKTQPTAYYWAGSLKTGRPGIFYANTYDLKARPKWEMEALALHEAVPGHHLQISLAQEMEGANVPEFRRHESYTAFVEGWGLYSESLGGELGLCKDPYSKFGQLTYEIWRSIRLVVDTGIHSKGWTREQAVEYFKQNAGKSEHDIRVEVDRYIVWPGQALAYKIGQMKIKELRQRAEKQLGDKFSLRSFHGAVLGAGALPLSILEQRIEQWMKNKGEQ